MDDAIAGAVMITEFMNLGVTVVTSRDAVVGPGGLNLNILQAAEFQALRFVARLQEPAAAAAAIVV